MVNSNSFSIIIHTYDGVKFFLYVFYYYVGEVIGR
jgi:hypothetical protein